MAIKEYDSENPVTMAKEPIVAYVSSSGKQAPPCQYTEEEVVQRVLQATADVDAGRNLMTHEEFKNKFTHGKRNLFCPHGMGLPTKPTSLRKQRQV